MRTSIFLATAIALLPGAGGADDLAKRDAKKLEGTWVAVSSERKGKVRPKEDLEKHGVQLVFQGDTFALTAGGKDEAKGTFKLDRTKKPHRIDLMVPGRDGKSVAIPGIYKLEGDTLTLATGLPAQARPTEFKTTPDSLQETAVYKRAKK